MQTSRLRVSWTELLLQAILLVAALVCVFPKTFFKGEMIAPGSILYELYPWKAHKTIEAGGSDKLILDAITAMDTYYALAERALENGEWPLWNHMELAGMPLMANCQSAVFYPPRLLHGFLDVFVATTFYILLKLWLCGMTAYVCARGMGMGRGAARFASFGWMLSSYNIIWCYWPLPDVGAWIPIIVLGLECLLDERYRRGFFTLALGATLILLAGHPETAFVYGLGAGLYFLLRCIWERRRGRRLWMPMAVAVGAWSLALLVCAAQLIPFAEYLVNSYSFAERAARDPERKFALVADNVAAFWVPRFFGTWAENNFWGKWNSNLTSMVYPGMAVWLALCLLPCRMRNAAATLVKDRARVWALALSALVFGLIAFDAPPLDFVNRLPVFNTMYVAYYGVWPFFALVCLGALGLDRWLAQPRRLRELAWVLPMLAVAVALDAFVYWFNAPLLRAMHFVPYLQTQVLLAVAFAGIGILILAAFCFWRRPALVAAALTVLLAADLILGVRGILATSPRDELFIRTALTDYLLGFKKPCRVETSMGLIPCGIMPVYGIEQWTGYDGLYPERVLGFQKRLATDLWKGMEPVCSVEYYLHDPRIKPMFPRDELGCFQLAASFEGIEVYWNSAALPRAFLVGRGLVLPDVAEMFETMRQKRGRFDPGEEVLLESMPAAGLPKAPRDALGKAEVTEWQSTRVVVQAETQAPAILVLSDAYYPGWKAFMDGSPTELFPVDYAFRGVSVPPGPHTIEYRYDPLSFRLGLAISIMALIASGAAAAFFRARRV